MEPVLDVRSDDEVEASIAAKHRELCRIHRSLLADVAEHDRREAFSRCGAKDEDAFLVGLLGLGRRTASSWVNAAHVLQHHPEVAERYLAGEMSADQLSSVVEMLRLRLPGADKPVGPFGDPQPEGGPGDGSGTGGGPGSGSGSDDGSGSGPDDPRPGDGGPDDGGPDGGPAGAGSGQAGGGEGGAANAVNEVLGMASRMSPGQLAGALARMRRRSRADAAAAHRRRHLTASFDEANSRLHLEGDLFDDQALIVWSALVEYAKRCGKDPATGKFEPLPARFADALGEMASGYLGGRQQLAARPAIFAFCDASVLAGGEGWAESFYGGLAAETIRRMACECELTLLAEGPDNRLFMGRTKRYPTWQQKAMVIKRDGGCRFGPCHQKTFLHIHHMQEWVKDSGPTDWDQLFPACSQHHHLVHEGGWTVSGDPAGELVFTDPTGTIRLSSWPNPVGNNDRDPVIEPDGERQRPPHEGLAAEPQEWPAPNKIATSGPAPAESAWSVVETARPVVEVRDGCIALSFDDVAARR